MMAATWALLLFGLVLLGGVIGLVILLSHPRTRAAAGLLLSILGVIVALAVLAVPVFTVRVERRSGPTIHEVKAESRVEPLPAADAADSLAEPAESAVAEPNNGPPAWLESNSTWTRENAYWARVRVGPYPRDEADLSADQPLPRKVEVHELQQALSRDTLLHDMLRSAVDEAVAQYGDLLEPAHPVHIELPIDFVLRNLLADAWQSAAPPPEAIPLESGQEYAHMVNLHLLLKFDAGTRQQLVDLRRQKLIEARIGTIGRGLFCLLVVLGAVLLYLKTWRPPMRTGVG
ncbi:MAG: hypothetical protein RBS80_01375 [Thermoguttaceae bacterium]|jgi:hypothetical protein|nr:hypothetical protein [Thermoguttaceae bacterium]